MRSLKMPAPLQGTDRTVATTSENVLMSHRVENSCALLFENLPMREFYKHVKSNSFTSTLTISSNLAGGVDEDAALLFERVFDWTSSMRALRRPINIVVHDGEFPPITLVPFDEELL